MRLIFLLILTFSVNTAIACSCDRSSIVENFKGVDIVFKGRVIEVNEIITEEEIAPGRSVNYKRYAFKFEIITKYKGLNKKEPITIITTGGVTDCGNDFELDKKYIVYAYKQDTMLALSLIDRKTEEFLTTNLCTRTKRTYPWTVFESLVLTLI